MIFLNFCPLQQSSWVELILMLYHKRVRFLTVVTNNNCCWWKKKFKRWTWAMMGNKSHSDYYEWISAWYQLLILDVSLGSRLKLGLPMYLYCNNMKCKLYCWQTPWYLERWQMKASVEVRFKMNNRDHESTSKMKS